MCSSHAPLWLLPLLTTICSAGITYIEHSSYNLGTPELKEFSCAAELKQASCELSIALLFSAWFVSNTIESFDSLAVNMSNDFCLEVRMTVPKSPMDHGTSEKEREEYSSPFYFVNLLMHRYWEIGMLSSNSCQRRKSEVEKQVENWYTQVASKHNHGVKASSEDAKTYVLNRVKDFVLEKFPALDGSGVVTVPVFQYNEVHVYTETGHSFDYVLRASSESIQAVLSSGQWPEFFEIEKGCFKMVEGWNTPENRSEFEQLTGIALFLAISQIAKEKIRWAYKTPEDGKIRVVDGYTLEITVERCPSLCDGKKKREQRELPEKAGTTSCRGGAEEGQFISDADKEIVYEMAVELVKRYEKRNPVDVMAEAEVEKKCEGKNKGWLQKLEGIIEPKRMPCFPYQEVRVVWKGLDLTYTIHWPEEHNPTLFY